MLKKHGSMAIVAAGLLGFILATTHPSSVHLAVLMLVFGLLYVFMWQSLVVVGLSLKRLGIASQKRVHIGRIAAGAAALPVFLLILQSIGQLTIRDVALASGLFLLLYLYFSRMSAANS